MMQLPRVKTIHNPIRLSQNLILIGTNQYGLASEIQDDEEGHVWRLLELMDGTRTIDGIIQQMVLEDAELDEESIANAIETLIRGGFIEDAAGTFPENLSPDELERYQRNTNYFAWVDTSPRTSRYELQGQLKKARVTLLGLGGTGSAIAMSLVAAGIGALHCVDFDTVEVSNLNRQLLYTEEDLHRSKVHQAIQHLKKLNSYVTITGEELKVESSEDLDSLMQACDLFILCADHPPAHIREWTNAAALRTHTPWLISFYNGAMLTVGMFLPFQTPCYRCYAHYAEQKNKERYGETRKTLYDIPSDGVIPERQAVIAPSANLAGHLAALEAIYFLTGLPTQTAGRVFHQNLLIYDHVYYVEPPCWPDCPSCGTPSVVKR